MVNARAAGPEKLLKRPGGGVGWLYLLSGPDSRGIDRAIAELSRAIFADEPPDLNMDTVHVGEVPVPEIVSRARTVPFFGERRLVIVRGCERIKSNAEIELFLDYIKESHNPSTTLVLVAREPDMRRKLFATAAKEGVHEVFGEPKSWDAPHWIRKRAGELGLKIRADAAHALTECAGTDPDALSAELEKLSLHAGEGNEIGMDDVRALLGRSRKLGIFQLTDALGDRRADEALKVLDSLLAPGGDAPIHILVLLVWQVRRMLVARGEMDQGVPVEEAVRAAGVHPRFAGKFTGQMKKFSEEELTRSYRMLLDAEKQLKSSSGSPRLVLELLLARLCS